MIGAYTYFSCVFKHPPLCMYVQSMCVSLTQMLSDLMVAILAQETTIVISPTFMCFAFCVEDRLSQRLRLSCWVHFGSNVLQGYRRSTVVFRPHVCST